MSNSISRTHNPKASRFVLTEVGGLCVFVGLMLYLPRSPLCFTVDCLLSAFRYVPRLVLSKSPAKQKLKTFAFSSIGRNVLPLLLCILWSLCSKCYEHLGGFVLTGQLFLWAEKR